MSRDEFQPTCRRCDRPVVSLFDGQEFRCGCGTFPASCDNCGSPYDGEDGSCFDCYNDACEDEDDYREVEGAL